MSSKLKFPYIGLIISGGHTALVLVKNFDSYVLLGQTQDDAAGEAFDKVAKVLDLGYPGGPAIDKISKGVKIEEVVDFPRSYLHKESADFSFSGLKTAVLYYVRDNYKGKKITEKEKAKIAAGFQESVIDVLIHKSLLACSQNNIDRLALGGGVSSNSRLRDRLLKEAKSTGVKVFFPEEQLCQDNAAMIAGLAAKLYDMGYSSDFYISCEATLSV
jgi:N6-L-threonylcarbamoyladenine synthase